jgi:hypothetical protein
MDTPKKFFTGRTLGFMSLASIAVLVVLFYILNSFIYKQKQGTGVVVEPNSPSIVGEPTFVWKYENDATQNPDGFPQTVVSVVATYPNGASETKKIDTVDGSCNDLPDAEADSVPGTTAVQCYYAGFGYRFKITQGPASYLVQRKEFEEASPDYNPPVAEYEVVAEFAL